MAAGADYRTIRARGLNAQEVEAQLVSVLADERSFEVRRIGPGRLGVYRTYRPTWALVLTIVLLPFAGVGLLFLLVKKSEPGEVLIVDGPTGTQVTLPPVVPDDLDALIDARLTGGTTSTETVAAAVGNGPSGAAKRASGPNLISEVPGPEASPEARGPGVTTRPVPPRSVAADFRAEDIDAVTVKRPAVGAVPSRQSNDLLLRFGVVSVVLSHGDVIVLGRAPSGWAGARQVVVPGDASTVSKTHATVRVTQAGAEVMDLDSTNGTLIERDGAVLSLQPGQAVPLREGDAVVFGAVRAEVMTA